MSRPVQARGTLLKTGFLSRLPDLLKDVNKIIYMDADAIALDDIAEIYSYETGNCYVGGVRDIVGYLDEENRCKELSIGSLDQYVNAGVLLMNLDEMRKDRLSEKMLATAEERSFSYNDQDIINSLCYGRIKCLPCKCNAVIDYLEEPAQISAILQIDYKKEAGRVIILHYAGRAKPWYSRKGKYAPLWWSVADSFSKCETLLIKYSVRKLRLKVQKTN